MFTQKSMEIFHVFPLLRFTIQEPIYQDKFHVYVCTYCIRTFEEFFDMDFLQMVHITKRTLLVTRILHTLLSLSSPAFTQRGENYQPMIFFITLLVFNLLFMNTLVLRTRNKWRKEKVLIVNGFESFFLLLFKN